MIGRYRQDQPVFPKGFHGKFPVEGFFSNKTDFRLVIQDDLIRFFAVIHLEMDMDVRVEFSELAQEAREDIRCGDGTRAEIDIS